MYPVVCKIVDYYIIYQSSNLVTGGSAEELLLIVSICHALYFFLMSRPSTGPGGNALPA